MNCLSLAELKEQAAVLQPEEQAELAAFGAERLRRDDPTYRKELARLRDDRDPQHWQRWSDVKEEANRVKEIKILKLERLSRR